MTNNVEHLFMCLLAIIISLVKRVFKTFKIQLFFFLLLNCKSFYIFSNTSLLTDI